MKNNYHTQFDSAASSYDQYAMVQSRVFNDLIKQIHEKEYLVRNENNYKIYDIGCGTGRHTSLLHQHFPNTIIKAIDISPAMINFAKKHYTSSSIHFIEDNAEKITDTNNYDLIFSNATFQWFNDLKGTLKKLQSQLNKNGHIVFSIFGPQTFIELKQSLSLLLQKPIIIPSSSFKDEKELETIILDIFPNAELQQVLIHQSFPSLIDLLKNIKFTGVKTTTFHDKTIWSPSFLKKLEEVYLSRYRSISATHQVFYCTARKEDIS